MRDFNEQSKIESAQKTSLIKKGLLYGGSGLALLLLVSGSFFTVNQTEVGAVTRFGALVSDKPVEAGLHFKIPFIDTAHTIPVSINKIPIEGIKVKTKDNQFVFIDVNLTYNTTDPFRALFKVGIMGNGGVHDKVVPYVQSRTLDEFGKVSALEIPDSKGAIESSILKDVQIPVLEMFGENISDVQITGIHYDPGFEANVQEMVKTRNAQVSAQNMLQVRITEAQQAAAVAKGVADAAVIHAEGEKQRVIKEAEANAQKVTLAGQAQAEALKKVGQSESDVIKQKVQAAGNPETYADILRAEASKNWNGNVPTYSFGASTGVNPILMIPNGK